MGVVPYFAAAVLMPVLVGCSEKAPVTNVKQAQQAQLRQADRADALLKAAASQLHDLPSAVETELKPPQVILDAQKSADHRDVFAACIANPALPDSPVNLIRVSSNNSMFRVLGVRSGDVLKYFVLEDETVDEESRQKGLSRRIAMELKVAQVLDDVTLLIETGLNQEVTIPEKIEIWRYGDTRQKEINEKLRVYAERRLPALGWEPAGDDQVITQILAWLNQWIRQSNPPSDWKREPLLDSMPDELTNDPQLGPVIKAPALAEKSFQPHDGRILQEAVWLRDISRWAHGDSFDDLGRGAAFFDWSVRNVQLQNEADYVPHRPWHTLVYGRGTAAQRAWVFALLCRQQGLNVVMLGIPITNTSAAENAPSNKNQVYWLAALFSNGQLYLFDPQLGLPLRTADGKSIATLAQAQVDDSLLRKLDIEGLKYPLTADSLKVVNAYIIADPFELTRRAAQLEEMLSGEDHLSLAVNPSELSEQLKDIDGVRSVALWDVPFRTLRDQLTMGKGPRLREALAFEPFAVRPGLWKARTRHFQGRRTAAKEPSGELLDDHQEAARLYMNVRPTDRKIARSPSVDERRVDKSAKLDATYYLGLLKFDDGGFDVAADWFGKPELHEADSPFASGARYNQARSLEAAGEFEAAATLLEKDSSLQAHGNKLRALELKSRPQANQEPEKGK